MILTVTPNPALDLSYRVPRLEVGESHRVAAPAVRAGGKGINVARVVNQTGGCTTALITAGGVTGDRMVADLRASQLVYELVAVQPDTRTTIAIVDESVGEATLFNEAGLPLADVDWTRLETAADRLAASAQCLVGSGSLPSGAPTEFFAAMVRIAHEHGIPSIIDTTGEALLRAAQAGASVVKPNRQELAETTGEIDPHAGAIQLINRGAGLVIVSLGGRGMLAVSASDPSHPKFARLDAVLSGNATGAGDAAVAAIASCFEAGETDVIRILTRATSWSAAAVLAPLAGELHPSYLGFEHRISIAR